SPVRQTHGSGPREISRLPPMYGPQLRRYAERQNLKPLGRVMDLDCSEFLEELHHLFGSPPDQLPNGKRDHGFNCYAKAFVVMYLCRLRGMAVDVCLGDLFIMQKGIPEKYAAVVEPHAWVGSPKHRVID